MAHYLTGIPASFIWYPSNIMVCFKLIYLLIFDCTGSLLLHVGFSLAAVEGVTLLCSVQASHCGGFSYCVAWTQEHRLSGCSTQAQWLQHTGLDASWHVGSSQTRDRTCVPCIGGWILNHRITREVPHCMIFITLTIPCEVSESGTLPAPSL